MNCKNRKLISYLRSALLVITSVLFIVSCSNPPPPPFEVPSEFDVLSHDTSTNEILTVEYEGEMIITVTTDMSKIIKESALFGGGPMRVSYEAKFPLILNKIKGKNPSEQTHYLINDHLYLHRSFDYGDAGYYEFGAMYIEEPEEYY